MGLFTFDESTTTGTFGGDANGLAGQQNMGVKNAPLFPVTTPGSSPFNLLMAPGSQYKAEWLPPSATQKVAPQQMQPVGGGFIPQGQPGGAPGIAQQQQQLQSWMKSFNPTPYQPSQSDQWLTGLAGNMGYLKDWAANPRPISWEPAWEQMKIAQERGIKKGAADLGEYFNTMGGRFSTSYGNAMGDYMGQAVKDQNAALGMLETQALESALGRQHSAAGQMGQFAFGGPALQSQLANQRYLAQNQQEYGLESLLRNQQYGAAMYNAQATDNAQSQLYNGSIYGANALNQGATFGAQNLYNTANGAAQSMYQNQTNTLPLALQQFLQTSGMNLSGAQAQNNAYQQNLGLGGALGGQQYTTLQSQMDRLYQEFIRQQPHNNPLISLMQQLGLAQTNMYYPQQQPGAMGDIMGLTGAILPFILKMFGGGKD
jgi:hypothetical protein